MSDITHAKSSLFDKIAQTALGSVLLLIPIFFVPLAGFTIGIAKFGLLFTLIAVALVSYAIARARDGVFTLPNKTALLSLGSVALIFFISAISSQRFSDGFVGFGFELTTVLGILLLTLTAFLSSVYAQSTRAVTKGLRLVGLSFVILAVYQLVRLFSALITQNINNTTLSLGSFVGPYGNLLGKLNDIALFSGMVMLVVVITWRGLSKRDKYIAAVLFLMAGFLAKVIAFSLLWPVLAVFLLIYIIWDSLEFGRITLFSKKGLTVYRGIVVATSILMILFTALTTYSSQLNSQGRAFHPRISNVVNFIPNQFGGVQPEVRPSTVATLSIYKQAVKKHLVFGQGPNSFTQSWSLYRSPDIQKTPYGDTDFSFGVGYFPTLMVTVGILGTIALLFFILCAIKAILSVAFSRSSSNLERSIAYSTALLLVFSVIYVPVLALVVYLFFGIGFVFAKSSNRIVTLKNNKWNSTAIKVTTTLVAIFLILVGTTLVKEYRANRYLTLASSAVTKDKNIALAEEYIVKAIKLHETDVYYRAMAELLALKTNVIVSQNTTKEGSVTEEVRAVALKTYDEAIKAGEKAVAINPTNYVNYLFVGKLYETNPSKLESAIDSYNKVFTYSPNNPNAYFGIARVKALQNDIDGLKLNIEKALEIRPGFTDALLAGAQVKANEKDVKGTLDFLVQAYKSNPQRIDLLLTIAQLQYIEQKDLNGAVQTLEYLVGNNPTYADGRLALASLYAKNGKYEEASNLLVGIKTDDEKTRLTLDSYIAQLKNNQDPFIDKSGVPIKTATSTAKVSATSTAKKK